MSHFQIQKLETYFDEINSPNKAYLLGLLFADGCNTRKGFSVTFHEQDDYALDWFISEIVIGNRKPKINKYKDVKASTLHLVSRKLSDALTKAGCIPNKSQIEAPAPDLEESLWPHFIRGVFDGDGSSTLSKRFNSITISILGGELLLNRIKGMFEAKGIFCNIYKTSSKHCHEIKLAERASVKRFAKWIYSDAEFFFKRKREAIESFCAKLPPEKIQTKGVGYCAHRKKWYATIWRNKKTVNLGRFETKEEAYAARIKYEQDNSITRRHRHNLNIGDSKV